MLALALLQACKHPDADVRPSEDSDTHASAPSDADGDGSLDADDCDDADGDVHPGAPEVGDGRDRDCDGRIPPAPADHEGSQVDEGFGTRVVLAGGVAWASAPFSTASGGWMGGRLYRDGAVALEGEGRAATGAGLAALDDGTVLVGEPGAGRIRTGDGQVVWEAPGAGSVLAARGSAWVASTPTGARGSDAATYDWGARPDTLAILADGRVVAGFARGDVALRIGDVEVTRGTPRDEAGYALAVGDADGDGDEDVIVGVPGAGAVAVVDPAAPPASLGQARLVSLGTGRFGAAVAVFEPGRLYVGAPMDGADVTGAVYRVDALGAPTVAWAGDKPGGQLGAALSARDDAVLIGAPGAATDAGRALLRVP